MLGIRRRIGQRVLIGDTWVEVFGIDIANGGEVRLGIDAPPGVPVIREELMGSSHEQDIRQRAADAARQAGEPR